MKRLFGKFSRSSSRSPDEPKDDLPLISPQETLPPAQAETADSEAVQAASSAEPIEAKPAASEDVPEFEMRKPTPEEVSAPILSRQDFIDLDRMFAGTATPRVIPRAKPPVLSPGVQPTIVAPAAPVPAAPATRPPVEAAAPVTAPVKQPDHPVPAPAAAEAIAPAPAPKPLLVGYWEGFFFGKVLNGWVGDPADPTTRSIRVTALLDGKEVASAIASRERSDTPFAGYHIPFPDPMVWKYILENRLELRAARDGEEPIILQQLAGVAKLANQAKQAYETEQAEAKRLEAARKVPAAPTQQTAPASAVSSADALSYLRVPIGTIARDRSVIVGGDGFLFGYRSVGKPAIQFAVAASDQGVQHDAATWFGLFRSREALLARHGISYVQVILPHKATVMHDLAPVGLGPITARLGVLEALFEAEAKRPDAPQPTAYYGSLITALRSCHTAGVAPYLRTGNGLRSAGTQLVFYKIAQRMASVSPSHAESFATIIDLCGHLAPGKESAPFTGDLGGRFDLPIYESEQLPDLGRLESHVAGDPDVVDQQASGSRLIWRNPKAPS
ncbi:MAG: hypothetical protein JWR77_2507, partial [Rhizorhabdus sp.]|nr:hypothetical protein [Rhizorhabdus sp.]